MTFKTTNGINKFYDTKSKKDALAYILNPIKSPQGYQGGVNIDLNTAELEMDAIAQKFNKKEGAQIRHWIFSFEATEIRDINTVKNIAEEVAQFFGRMYQTVFAIHIDTNYPHFHLAFNPVSFIDGARYRGSRADFYALQSMLKEVCARFGIKKVQYIHSKN